jgi:hypothetical protein
LRHFAWTDALPYFFRRRITWDEQDLFHQIADSMLGGAKALGLLFHTSLAAAAGFCLTLALADILWQIAAFRLIPFGIPLTMFGGAHKTGDGTDNFTALPALSYLTRHVFARHDGWDGF